MTTVREIYNTLFAFAPASMKLDWDNVGLLCGRFDAPVDTVLVALDPMPDVIAEAKETGAQCIVTHHPLFFDAPNAINDDSYAGRCLLELAEAKIAAINLHTNLDVCPGGVNDTLAETLGLTDVSVLNPVGTDAQGRPYGLIRTGTVREQRLAEFAAFAKSALSCPGLRFADAGKPVRRVAVGGGSCGRLLDVFKDAPPVLFPMQKADARSERLLATRFSFYMLLSIFSIAYMDLRRKSKTVPML